MKVLYARGWVQRFSCLAQQMERISLDLPRAVRKRYTLEVGCESVWNFWSQTNFFFWRSENVVCADCSRLNSIAGGGSN